jgi:hypothetical protein
MVYIASLFLVAGLVLSVLSIPAKRAIVELEQDIDTITSRAKELNTAIKAFPQTGGTIDQLRVSNMFGMYFVLVRNLETYLHREFKPARQPFWIQSSRPIHTSK